MPRRSLYAANILSLVLFFLTAVLVMTGTFRGPDSFVANLMTKLRFPALNEAMFVFSFLGEVGTASVISASVAILLILGRRLKDGIVFLVATGTASLLGLALKDIIMRPRPVEALFQLDTFSFPSGHTLFISVFAVLIVYFFYKKIKSALGRRLLLSGMILLALLVGFSRLYFNVHWFSDVLAGYFLGFFWSTLVIFVAETVGLEKPLHI